MTTQTEALKLVNSLMEQAQVFASAWSLVGGRFDGGNAIDDAEAAKNELRQMIEKALAQPEPSISAGPITEKMQAGPTAEQKAKIVEAMQAQLKEPEQEPVAWMYVNQDGECEDIGYGNTYLAGYEGCTPLYTSPPPQRPSRSDIKPLTDEQIFSIAYDCNALPETITDETLIIFARALWVVFGIKEKNQ